MILSTLNHDAHACNPDCPRGLAHSRTGLGSTIPRYRHQTRRASAKPSTDLGVLLQQRYGIKLNVSEAAARAALARYEGEEIVTIETQQDQKRKHEVAEARKKFVDRPVLIFPLTDDMKYSFDPNTVISIDASNTVYPTMRLVDAWGVLTVTDGAWLERGGNGHLVSARVPAPLKGALKGEGWSLELANGWEVVPGERTGDVTIRKLSNR